MGNYAIRRMALDGILAGVFLVLCLVRIRVGTFLEIGFGSIVLILAAVALSPVDALFIGLIGEFISQVFFSGYGLTPTTPLWVLPVALRGLLIGIVALIYKKKGDNLMNHKVVFYITCMAVALFISGLDTGILYLDGVIMGYPVAYTWAQTGIRFLSSQATAVVAATVVLPFYKAVVFLLPKDESDQRREATKKE